MSSANMTTNWTEKGKLAAERSARSTDPVPWVVALFLANFLLQRISILPNMSISVSTPLVLVWVVLALRRGVVEIVPHRLLIWVIGSGLSGLLVFAQLAFVDNAIISPTSWIFWIVIWLPVIVRFTDLRRETFLRTLRAVANVGLGIAGLSSLFMALQVVGVPYRDYISEILPDAFEVHGFVITYPIVWDSPIQKSNAWFALEPSFLSFTLGVCAVAALVARMNVGVFGLLIVGVLTTFAGSGLAIVAVSLPIVLLAGHAWHVRSHLIWGSVVAALAALTPVGDLVYGRVGEVGDGQSSTSLRAIGGYIQLWPDFSREVTGVLFGYGAGSSRLAVEAQGIDGLLVPNAAKMLFDYGLFVGAVMILMMVVVFTRSPSPAIGYSLMASTLILQAASQPLIICIFAVTTWWAPAGFRLITASSAHLSALKPEPEPVRRRT